ncbi:MAG: hypothetical protein IPK52_19750 [Chloroflexi bacterium]|nr:hypothetical protein [Chloroflexota bacterium]
MSDTAFQVLLVVLIAACGQLPPEAPDDDRALANHRGMPACHSRGT